MAKDNFDLEVLTSITPSPPRKVINSMLVIWPSERALAKVRRFHELQLEELDGKRRGKMPKCAI